MKRLFLYSLLIVYSSCALFELNRISGDVVENIQKVCVSADGNGRLNIGGHKYPFSFETALIKEEHKWLMSMHFPMFGEELIELNLLRTQVSEFKTQLEQKLIQKQNIDPILLDTFMHSWAKLLTQIIHVKQGGKVEDSYFIWSKTNKELLATKKIRDYAVKIDFNSLSEGHFTFLGIELNSAQNKQKSISIEMIVRKCLDKA